jgi:hypothetical protein
MERWGTSGRFVPFEKIYEVGVSIEYIIFGSSDQSRVASHSNS